MQQGFAMSTTPMAQSNSVDIEFTKELPKVEVGILYALFHLTLQECQVDQV